MKDILFVVKVSNRHKRPCNANTNFRENRIWKLDHFQTARLCIECVSPIYNFRMVHTLIQIQSCLFIISQPKVSFPFLIFKESAYMVFTSTCHYFYPVSDFETANGIHYLKRWSFPKQPRGLGAVELNNFRNPTVKFGSNFVYQLKRTNYAKFCMSPSLDETLPESVIPQENNYHWLCA